MKTNKKYMLIFSLLIFFSFILIFSLNSNRSDKFISINGTYQNKLNTFNNLIFDEESKTYYNYTQNEKSKGIFEKIETNEYILKTGVLKGTRIQVERNEMKVINDNAIEIYTKISDIPTIQDEL